MSLSLLLLTEKKHMFKSTLQASCTYSSTLLYTSQDRVTVHVEGNNKSRGFELFIIYFYVDDIYRPFVDIYRPFVYL